MTLLHTPLPNTLTFLLTFTFTARSAVKPQS